MPRPDKERTSGREADPQKEYAERLAARRRQEAQQAQRYARLARARNTAFVLIVLVAWLGEKERLLPLLLVLPTACFILFLLWRNRASRAWRRAWQAAGFYERRLACVEERWAGGGVAGRRYRSDSHPYAADLDLFGMGSLFERLCIAQTRSGQDTLAAWLLAPASAAEVRQRHAASAELRPQLDLREEWALLSAEIPAGNAVEELAAWGRAEPVFTPGERFTALALMLLTIGAFIGWMLGAGPVPFFVTLLLEAWFTLAVRRPVRRTLEPLEQTAAVLVPWAALLRRLEDTTWHAPRLGQLRDLLQERGQAASRCLVQLSWLVSFLPLGFLLLWSAPLGVLAEAWRRRCGPALARWRAAVGEFEALSALAAYAYDQPDDPFPELVDEGPCFEAEELGHPLLPRKQCVRNTVHLGGTLRLLLVSGSNMSGKSTFLRTIGVNAVLALAGAPVRAQRLRLSPVVLGATLRVEDSLQAGRSRFYAEIVRLRQLLELAKGTPPLLFLLDELLHGTNAEERRRGAEGVLRTLLQQGALGLATTHDLALTQLAEVLAPQAANVHFEDRLEAGTMTFDYCMRPGVAQSKNALALMRALGFDV